MNPAHALEKVTAVFCWVTSLCLSVQVAAATADNSPQLPTASPRLVPEQLRESSAVFVENNRQRADWRSQVAATAAEYQGDGLAVTATTEGARLRCVFQKLEGEATSEGLWLTSTVPGQPNDRFRVVAVAIGRTGEAFGVPASAGGSSEPFQRSGSIAAEPAKAGTPNHLLPYAGTPSIDAQTVRFIRPGLVEEYTVSMDGVRQDFVVLEKPPLTLSLSPSDGERVADRPGEGELRLELAVSGARVESMAGGVHPVRYAGQAVDHERGNMLSHGARLVLEKSGRKIAYSRLRVTDATGKELSARMEVLEDGARRSRRCDVESAAGAEANLDALEMSAVKRPEGRAPMPIRIDPTFSDVNWSALGSGMDYSVYALTLSGSDLPGTNNFWRVRSVP
ncbi:MAG: hypothetical protein IH623_26605 [Verrucomicrobia bacterium]|nr:hypothetical protein [Verrucomicrobiota bacterium]